MSKAVLLFLLGTNRIFDKSKRYGMVVIFQRSAQYQTAVDGALLLYSNGGTKEVSAPTFAEIEKDFKEALAELRRIAATPEAVENIMGDRSAMQKFAKAFQKVDHLSGEIQVYQEWEDKEFSDYGVVKESLTEYGGKYHNVIEELKTPTSDEEPVVVDIGYEIENIRSVTIDYRYIVSLIQNYMPGEDELIVEPIEDTAIDSHIDKLRETNPALADVIGGFWEDMKKDPLKYKGLDAMTVIESRIEEIIAQQINSFTKEWCAQKKDVLAILNTFRKGDKISLVTDYEAYKQNHEGVSKLKYNRNAKDAVIELIEKIRPLREK